MSSALSRKLEDVSKRSLQHSASMPVMRNTPSFKSFEEKVGTWKNKMSPSEIDASEQMNVPDDAEAQHQDTPTNLDTPLH
ncbi:tumor protein D52 isoform X1 [Hippocampus comes]|uniref:tumor protein D52 isoform X1 n=1 Tax=Hippocampus comes TaxID=109280 RepID=UPI00094E4808|nr:PREDICTED: tumor protein D52 isoform X1 [Hippocampus comes]